VVNYLHAGHFCNPSLALVFPISGHEVFSGYPPGYQVALLAWMKIFGPSVVSAMALHLALFAVSALTVVLILRKFFPAAINYAPAVLLFFGFTFGDRPEDLAYVFGLGMLGLLLCQATQRNLPFQGFIITGLLLAALFTSPIVGSYYFGVGFLFVAAVWWKQRKIQVFLPFIIAALLFLLAVVLVQQFQPRWWAGFMESAQQQSVMKTGFHLPSAIDLFKLIRTAPVFLLGLVFAPFVWAHWRELKAAHENWLLLVTAIFVVGWGLLIASVTLLAPNYVSFVTFTQIFLAAGMLVFAGKIFPAREGMLRVAMLLCVLLVSVRAIGMTTWGVACTAKNSYGETQRTLRAEFEPFKQSDAPVFVSSAFLYSAAEVGVKNPVHCDWFYDHAHWTNGAMRSAICLIKPSKLALTQFDYYRSFQPLLEELKRSPEIVEVTVRDFAKVKTPDSIPSLQRVVQHISWAPVMVDLEWKGQ
jgi:MFS family permease